MVMVVRDAIAGISGDTQWWVCLTIIDQCGHVTSDNMMTWGRWVCSNNVGRCAYSPILQASARELILSLLLLLLCFMIIIHNSCLTQSEL